MNNKQTVLLGMSGGVDSSVSALILLNQGYNVIGATMQLFDSPVAEDCSCGSSQAAIDAKKVCDELGIQHYTLNFKKEFEQYVISDFCNEYMCGHTPNPCIRCNKFMKFGLLYNKAEQLGADFIATGHYAKRVFLEDKNLFALKKATASKKDQSYVLYNISQDILAHTIFPLCDFESKDQVRQLARENSVSSANKPDSQEICFISDNNYAGFIENTLGKNFPSGNILHSDGTVLGKHNGTINYTIGQRKGLKISYPTPLFVNYINTESNSVIVGDESLLFSDTVYAKDVNYIMAKPLKPLRVLAKIRYNAKETPATLYPLSNNCVKAVFDSPVRAVTLGQSLVFYENDILLGGGIICDEKSLV